MHKQQIDDCIKLEHTNLLSKEESVRITSKRNFVPHHIAVNINIDQIRTCKIIIQRRSWKNNNKNKLYTTPWR